ncbi:hypothetical protein KY342_05845 [Candidatus Woesearchaeota archaeon]|nr:hypothetical protein [Candidatus Woesearchaeota archaeon]
MTLGELKNWDTLTILADFIGIKINPEKPRESRLAVALEYDKQGKFYEAIEAISGTSIHEYSLSELQEFTTKRQNLNTQHFYESFPGADK